jgi:inosine-uridine nucleoside N-ribohydrolase
MAIGPLTNLGVAYHYDNDFPKRISCLSIMGCQYSGVGMWDYFAADFNFALDPHSANLVIKKFDHIAIVSLEYAFAYITDRVEDIFLNKSTRKAELVADIYKPII